MKEQSIRQKTADLAMLCDEDENFSEDINALVVIADKLAKKEIESKNGENSCNLPTPLREDTARVFENTEKMLKNAPKLKDSYIYVPRVMEGEQK